MLGILWSCAVLVLRSFYKHVEALQSLVGVQFPVSV